MRGQLPPGTRWTSPTGEIVGILRQIGNWTFEVAARDGVDPALPPDRDVNAAEDRRTFNVGVALGVPVILDQAVPEATYRDMFAYKIDAAGGTLPFAFALVAPTGGSPPFGLPTGVLLGSDGQILGMATDPPATWTFGVRLTDALGQVTQRDMTLGVILRPLLVSGTPLPLAPMGFAYSSQFVVASHGAGAPYDWSQVAPTGSEVTLSSIGFSLSSSGLLTSPSAPVLGDHTFTVQVTTRSARWRRRRASSTWCPRRSSPPSRRTRPPCRGPTWSPG